MPTIVSNEDIQNHILLMAKVGGCWSPALSPDNQQVAFISNLTGSPQVWRMSLSGGFPERVTAIEEYVTKVSWSPDGEWLAIEAAPGGGMNTQIYIMHPDGTELRQVTSGGATNNWFGRWMPDNQTILFSCNMEHPDSMDCYKVDIDTGETTHIISNAGTGRIAGFHADTGQLLINRVAYRGDNNFYTVDMATHQETLITPHEPPASFTSASFADEGKSIYILSNKQSDFLQLASFSLDDMSEWNVLFARDNAEIDEYAISKDGATIAVVWNIAGKTELELFNLETKSSLALIDLPGEVVQSLQFTEDDTHMLMCITGSTMPLDIWLMDMATHELTQLTKSPHAGVQLDALVSPRLEHYPAHDDVELSGWLYMPRDVEAPCPFVLSFHGGPEGQERPTFRPEYQALLLQGIGIFAPNIRGSGGFGKTFVNLDNGALRADAIRDIKSTVDYLIDKHIALPNKIGIMGGSYGGYMTMAGLSEYPDLFAAGVNIYGVVNFKTFFEQTEPWMARISKIEYGDPDTELTMLDELSPLTHVQRVIAPTLVIHGANDTNVPVYEAEQVVESLKQQNVAVEYILFPDEGHGFKHERNRITSTSAIAGWFKKYLLD